MTITSGTKGIVAYKGKLLLIHRDNKPDIPFPNTWEYVGGGKDENETFEQAGLREIEEEIGVRPRNYSFLGIENYPGRQAGRFIATLTDEEYANIKFGKEGDKYDFFSFDETLKLEMAPNLKKFLKANEIELKGIIEKGKSIEVSNFVFTKD